MGSIRVLVVDDSAMMRRVIAESLSAAADITVVGTASGAASAREQIHSLRPDVITLDLEMPKEDGLSFLRSLMQSDPMRVVVVSSQLQVSPGTAIKALDCGAMEVLAKPVDRDGWTGVGASLAQKVRRAAGRLIRERTTSGRTAVEAARPAGLSGHAASDYAARATRPLIAVGASTGGPEALTDLLLGLPGECPPIVITQHMPANFSKTFADRLNRLCPFEVKEAEEGDLILPRRVLIAPGGFHLVLRRSGATLRAGLAETPLVCFQRPSVDVMFHSVVEAVGAECLGVLLTGMGSDGAEGLQEIRKAGAHTIAQDEASCVVFGMPRAAIKLGAAEKVLPLCAIAPQLIRWVNGFGPGLRASRA